ncbi:MAG TPA: zinc finger domain-containing protein [Acidobacteriaceae bacterium]|nr:zinc finger domain-containing protein [Acidobacteriaceae bacterium]
MPEGNEIHRWADRHNAAFAKKKMRVEAPTGRFPDADAIDNRRLEQVLAKGKHLGYVFGRDRILHVHLGRYGDWTEGQMPLADVKGALRVRMWPAAAKPRKGAAAPTIRHGWYSNDDGSTSLSPEDVDWLELRGAAACELWTDAQWQALLDRLGPDPLNGDDPQPAFDRIGKAKAPISVLLMNQEILCGIGNIYRAELLFRARQNPFTPGRDVPLKTLKAIWKDSLPLLRSGMLDRRIVTTLPKHRPTKKTGPPLKPEVHYVYRRHGKPCFVCGTKVSRQEIAGRTLYWCLTCQA